MDKQHALEFLEKPVLIKNKFYFISIFTWWVRIEDFQSLRWVTWRKRAVDSSWYEGFWSDSFTYVMQLYPDGRKFFEVHKGYRCLWCKWRKTPNESCKLTHGEVMRSFWSPRKGFRFVLLFLQSWENFGEKASNFFIPFQDTSKELCVSDYRIFTITTRAWIDPCDWFKDKWEVGHQCVCVSSSVDVF